MAGKTPITGLRRWLKQPPMPQSIRVDGDRIIRIPNHQSRWSETEKTITALNVSTIEALDSDGNVLRAFNVPDENGNPSKQPERYDTQKEDWPDAPDAQMAVVITAACDRAASRHENAYRMSFDALTKMYDQQSLRLEEAFRRAAQLEAALLRSYEKIARLQDKLDEYGERDEEPDNTSSADVLVGQVLAQAASRVLGAGDNGKANGKAKS